MLGFSVGIALAQNPLKLGHINSQELLKSMPEQDSAIARLKAFEKDLMERMDQIRVEYNKKLEDYKQNVNSWTPAIREVKEKEIQDLQMRQQEFMQASQQDFQATQAKLMQPIIDKAHKAIETVGKENGFFYIFDQSLGSLLYISPESIDVLPLVQKHLGIKVTKK